MSMIARRRLSGQRYSIELREVTEEIRLGDLGQARRLGPAELGRDPRDREPYVRGVAGAAARAGLLEDQLHRASTSASRSIWSFVRRSVRATSSTSSIPG